LDSDEQWRTTYHLTLHQLVISGGLDAIDEAFAQRMDTHHVGASNPNRRNGRILLLALSLRGKQ
jgi:hypothetical protein